MVRLCSTSETRAKLLKSFSIDFIQSSIDFDEDAVKESKPKSFVYKVVKGKAKNAEDKYGLDIPILVADTVVVGAKGEILRKAKDINDAKKILLAQSGSKISIISAAILKSNKLEFIDISDTVYEFEHFSEDDLQKYLDSNLWQGKAGACMVEGFCKKYIKSVKGLQSTAMGLQVEKIIPWLEF